MKKNNDMECVENQIMNGETAIARDWEENGEWGPIFITEVPPGICDDSPVDGNDAPIAVCIGRLAGEPLTRRICFSTRYVSETEADAPEEVEVLFNNYDAIISLDDENKSDIRQQICEAMSCLGMIPDIADIWELTGAEFKDYKADVQAAYRGLDCGVSDSIDKSLMLIAFADPFDSEWDSYDTWEEAVKVLEEVTGVTAGDEVHNLYDTEKEVERFKGFKCD